MKIRLEIESVTPSNTASNAIILSLRVVGERLLIPIVIGRFEAESIVIEMENLKPNRPITHDLFKNFAIQFGITIKEVIINRFEDGIFYAKLICERDGIIKEIDSRTSDAVAMAVRFRCPVYTYRQIIDEVAIRDDFDPEEKAETVQEKEPVTRKRGKRKYENLSLEELDELLNKAVTEENYEDASRLRDEIQRRKTEIE